MSISESITSERYVPPDVAELWAELYEEAATNYERLGLAHQTSSKMLFYVGLGALVFVISALLGAQQFVYKPQQIAQHETATAEAAIANANATAIAVTATANAQRLDEETRKRNATATAEAQKAATSLAATSTAQAESNRATATAEASANKATATAAAEELRCRDISLYTLTVAAEPVLWPDPGYVFVTDKAWLDVRATWTVTNTSDCEWREVSLKTPDREEVEVELRRGDEEVTSVQPGETVEVIRHFPRLQAPTEGEWILVTNGLTLFDLPHLHIDLGEERWVIVRYPTPTPTDTPTPTPTETPKPNGGGDDNGDNVDDQEDRQ